MQKPSGKYFLGVHAAIHAGSAQYPRYGGTHEIPVRGLLNVLSVRGGGRAIARAGDRLHPPAPME
jgi:hypothetical protein